LVRPGGLIDWRLIETKVGEVEVNSLIDRSMIGAE